MRQGPGPTRDFSRGRALAGARALSSCARERLAAPLTLAEGPWGSQASSCSSRGEEGIPAALPTPSEYLQVEARGGAVKDDAMGEDGASDDAQADSGADTVEADLQELKEL